MTVFKASHKIFESFMKAANSFNLITQSDNNFNLYSIFSSLWQIISSAHKKTSVAIVKWFNKISWNADCCYKLIKSMNVNMSDLTLCKPPYSSQLNFPSTLRGVLLMKELLQQVLLTIRLLRWRPNEKLHVADCPYGSINPSDWMSYFCFCTQWTSTRGHL